jgi:branched-chain amino acid aminotransferase
MRVLSHHGVAMELASRGALVSPQSASSGAAYINDEFCRLEDAKISILDFAFLRSDACQDTVSVWKGRFFCLDAHLQRFRRSCNALNLDCPHDDEELADKLTNLVRRSGLKDAYVQMIAMRGQPAPGSRDIRTCRNHFAAFCIPYIHIAPNGGRGELDVIVSARPRIPSASIPSFIKNYHWIDFELALFEAYAHGGNTVVLTDGAGHVTEGPGFNIFKVAGNRIATPRDNILDGITRNIVIELARELGLDVEERLVECSELKSADEIFITSTAGGIMPVSSLNGIALPRPGAGPIAKQLSDLYWSRRAQGWRSVSIEDDRNLDALR